MIFFGLPSPPGADRAEREGMKMKTDMRYQGYKVRIEETSFGTSGTRFSIIALTEKGARRKDGRAYRYRYDPSANAGRGAVVENTLIPGAHITEWRGNCREYDCCIIECGQNNEEIIHD
jgi:hypothetical protein